MKLTKELEAEVLKAYHTYWDSYLKGDMETFASLLHENCHIIGSTMYDVFDDKKSAVEFYTVTADQVAGKAELRNRKIQVLPYGESVMVNEFCDYYFFGDEEWNFYGRGRMSTLLNKKETGWKIIHQHGSMPDSKAEEGEQVGTEKINQENRELREAVKRRTVELEHKNRELAIEAALERVRAVAMSMNKAEDMLLVCQTISEQLETLGTKEIRNVQTAIFNPAKGTYVNYEFYRLHDKSLITEVDYTTDKMTATFASNMQKGAGEFFTESLTGKSLKDWFEFQKTTPQFADPHLEDASSLNYYWFSLGPIALGISTYAPLSEEEINLFKRFRNVFELSYRRFLDITKAAAQAKEAQLEASLERMRAAAMGMRKPEELITICKAMFKELMALGFMNIRNAQVAIKNEEKQGYLICAYSDYEQMFMKEAPYNSSPIVKELYNELEKSHDAFYQNQFAGSKFEEWRKWRQTITAFTDSREESATSMCFYLYSIGSGHIGISTFNPITDEQVEIVKRFKTVFELSYQRYTDVAKAEAQAREAQIELALERVRARAMAMRSSEELNALIGTVFTELTKLDLVLTRCVIMIYDPELKFSRWWMANSEAPEDPASFYVQYHEHPPMQAYFDGWKKKELKYTYILEGVIKRNWDGFLFTETGLRELPGFVIEGMKQPYKVYLNASFNNFGNLTLATLEPLSDSHFDILLRFAKVFDLTYTRFNDIQVAEARAREAQIEIALERVRSRTMAMQKSNELPIAANLLFQQMQALGMPAWSAGYCIWDEDKQGITLWMSSEGVIQPSFYMPLTVDPSMIHMKEAHKRGESFHVEAVGGEELVGHYRYMRTLPGIGKVLDDIIDAGHPLPSFQIFHCVYFSQGFLLFITYEPVPDSHEIFKRFGNVFDQTYTRFLDLQKSEAQAREAQVQLAMERVRARTMAMQHSNELAETSFLMAKQVRALGIEAWGCAFNIFDEDADSSTEWFSNEDAYLPTYKTPREGLFLRYYEAAQRGEELYIEEFKGEVCTEHYRFLSTIPVLGDVLRQLKESGISFPSSQIDHVVFFKHGYLLFITYEPVPEAYDIFKRFAKVFEQTYTRFLDLQKAEEQAKESLIQLALERVRARTMAMQHSDELQDAASLLFKQIEQIGTTAWACGYNIWGEDKKTATAWMSAEGRIQPPFESPSLQDVYLRFYEAEQRGENFYTEEMGGEELVAHYRFLRTLPVVGDIIKGFDEKGISLPTFQIFHISYFAQGYLMFITYEPVPELWDIFKRFAKVFEQTYTRFLDLQKAETQARQAQIEAGLEKVRSRTMAMQKSEELLETSTVLYKQLKELNVMPGGITIGIINEEETAFDLWVTGVEGIAINQKFRADIQEPLMYKKAYDSWKQQQKNLTVELTGSDLPEFMSHLKRMGFPVIDNPDIHQLVDSFAFFSHGYISIISVDLLPPETIQLLEKFAAVFDLTYTRFLDLKKAEAQARESQIQLALERVRAKTMAMYHSSELADTASVLFQQIKELGFEMWSSGFCIWKENDFSEAWMGAGSGGLLPPMMLPYKQEPTHRDIYEAYLQNEAVHEKIWEGEALEKHYEFLHTIPSVREALDQLENAGLSLPVKQCYYVGFFKQGYLLLITKEPKADALDLTKQFARVFDQTYTRFLDLQKSEAQAGEAKIEAALERVRSRSMGMQKSEELKQIIQVVYEQFVQLNIFVEHSGFIIDYKERDDMNIWLADSHTIPTQVTIPYFDSPHWNSFNEAKQKGSDFFVNRLSFEEKNKFYQDLFKVFPGVPEAAREYYFSSAGLAISTVLLDNVGLYIENFSAVPYTDEENNTLMRFGKVFQQTYTRFQDLQKAEGQTREAKIEAALERVRSRTLAMQKSDELAETAAVLFRQLILLGIAPNRLYIGLIKDDNGRMEFWVTDEDGTKVNTQFTGDANRNASMKKLYNAWKEQARSLTIDMQGEELTNYFHYLSDELKVPFKHGLSQKRRIQSAAYFGKGFIGMASPDPQPEETMNLLERFAAVFNLTYTRFNDLQVAEAHAIQAEEDLIKLQTEKKRAEEALSELRATQTQLIQSEKMASLGELTAGIAHEIQNPLNFVNNFSELSNELLDEMLDEVKKGNFEEVKAIVDDIKQNLEKINHHGKRADGIVKGMLQHSRSSSGQKDPTDINVLADEYLRLAYHGLRAKDKFFNATLKTDYDQSIDKLTIIPQDIGRVMLNIITNAFYAVTEKKKLAIEKYEPTVSVMTKRDNGTISVIIKDNGNGIPAKVMDKIFQPFFTTKPTGEGTGLGLSLAYDIVKAHGGEIKVNTKEFIGTEFSIHLPSN